MSKIFISYRREDSADTCGRIYDRLRDRFGKDAVFKDVDSIPLGVSFRDYIASVIRQCAVELVVIGPRWVSIPGEEGRPRLAHPEDNVRIEVEAGLTRKIPVIPVLVQNASIPDRAQLPESLRALPDMNGLPVRRDPDFDTDMHRLIRQLEQWLGEVQPAQLASSVGLASLPIAEPAVAILSIEDRVSAELDAAFDDRDWPAVVDKGGYLTRRAPGTMGADTNLKYGLALLEEGEPGQALAPLNAALALAPTDLRVLHAAARARQLAGQSAQAEPILQDALALVNDRSERLSLLAEYVSLLADLKRWDEAIRRCAEALRLVPGDPQWQARQLRSLREAHRDPEALEVARALTARTDATADDWLTRARLAYEAAGNKTTDEVRATIEAAARLVPTDDGALAQARQEMLPPPSLPPSVQRVSLPPDRLPPTLVNLGFIGLVKGATTFILPPVCSVTAGPFTMGSDKRTHPQGWKIELPEHQVTLPDYQIGRFPVTVAEYAFFVAAGHREPNDADGVSWQTQLTRLDHPVTHVDWYDAATYAGWLAELSGQPWRLPTEAEWEKAARWDPQRSVARIYPWGDQFDPSRCNTKESGIGGTTAVYSFPNGASAYKVEDMAGNANEWTSSIYKPYPYDMSDGREDPNPTEDRVPRSGSWYSEGVYARADLRLGFEAHIANALYGFRLALG